MATHIELRGLFGNDELLNRLEVAVIVKARAVLTVGTPALRVAWAREVFEESQTEAEGSRMLRYLLAGCSAMEVAAIKATTDADLNTAVSDAVDQLYV